MKNKLITLILTFLLVFNLSTIANADIVAPMIDSTKANEGIITINYESDKQLAAVVNKDGKKEQYILSKDNKTIPLQLGDGKYEIVALEQKQGTTYKVLSKITINVKLTSENGVYLQSINQVNFNKDQAAIKKAKDLTRGLKSDQQKVAIIYSYVISNIVYDNDKIKLLSNNYLPNISDTFSTNKGICYDYASLTAGMLRSLGIPTKLVKGYATGMEEYHAWNEVFINGQWKIIDTTADAVYLKAGMKFNMYKTIKEYNNITGTY